MWGCEVWLFSIRAQSGRIGQFPISGYGAGVLLAAMTVSEVGELAYSNTSALLS